MNNIKSILGEFKLSNENQGTAHIACAFVSPIKVEIIVQDQLGRAVISKSFDADESTTSLSIDISKLDSGNYHTWIYFEDQQLIRSLKVTNNEAGRGFVESFFKMFT